MLGERDNELLCRVEGAAPMGGLMRRHWIPACMSEEVAEPDGDPVRIRLLGEDLVAFRDSDGRLGVLAGGRPWPACIEDARLCTLQQLRHGRLPGQVQSQRDFPDRWGSALRPFRPSGHQHPDGDLVLA